MEEQILAVDLSTEQTLEVNLPEQDNVAQIDVYWQDEVVLDLDASLMYIVSGQQEIQDYVDNKSKPEIDEYIETYAKPIVVEVVEQEAKPIIDEYFEGTVKPSITAFAEEEMAGYAQVATEQATIATTQAGLAEASAVLANTTAQEVDVKVTEFEITKNAAISSINQAKNSAISAIDGEVEDGKSEINTVKNSATTLINDIASQATSTVQSVANNAQQYATQASNSATSASQSAAQAKTSETNAKSYADSVNPDRFLNKEMITNCIAEIPQDIKLELNNGTLTLKAGSKVYIPNGVGKFDEKTTTIDQSKTAQSVSDGNYMILPLASGNFSLVSIAKCVSGATDSLSGQSRHTWYDTTNNVVNYYGTDGSIVENTRALPIAFVTVKSATITSIDQVFNGFGYIGSTVFALPGVKGLIPNGRNADGTLRNIEFTIDKVLVNTYGTANGSSVLRINNGNSINATANVVYDEDENLVYIKDEVYPSTIIGNAVFSSGVITSFNTKLPFRAVDYNDAAATSMPSNKYIDLTFGASGTKYTAPANGWFVVRKRTAAANQGLFFGISNGAQFEIYNPVSGAIIGLTVPAKGGDVLNTSYSAGGTTEMFRFIYAEGDK
jgi:hypothetical protein